MYLRESELCYFVNVEAIWEEMTKYLTSGSNFFCNFLHGNSGLKITISSSLPSAHKKGNLLIGLLKLFLFRKVAVHIFENSAFRNPFIPAAKEKNTFKP